MTLSGQTALVTGASSGLGAAFARALARRGAALVLVARSEGVLHQTAEQLRGAHGGRVEVISQDLAQEGAADAVAARLTELGVTVDMLVNNAGFATQGPWETIRPERDHAQVMVNVVAVVDLTHALVPGMLERGAGSVVNVASLGGFQPAPRLAVYAASKAFVLSLGQALAAELGGGGVRVLTVCPGPIDTPFFDVLGSRDAAIGQQVTPEQVVDRALRALERGRTLVVPGWRNALTAHASRLLPRRLVLAVAERATRPLDTL